MDDAPITPVGRVTLHVLAQELGLSTATVSLALRESPVVADATRTRVLEAARERGYVANRSAASLRTARTNIIGVGLHDILNPAYAEFLASVEETASAAGKSMLLGVSNESVERQARVLNTLAEYRPDALLVGLAANTKAEDLKWLSATGIVIVQVIREVEGAPFDFAGCDDAAGTHLATRHLLELGHRRIGMVSGVAGTSTNTRRSAGYHRAMREAGLTVDPALQISGMGRRDRGRQAMAHLLSLDEPPTAAISFNDATAFGIMMELMSRGLRLGEDFSLVGFDNVEESGVWSPPLTTIDARIAEYGSVAARLALSRIADPSRPVERVELSPRLVVRATTGAPRPVKRQCP